MNTNVVQAQAFPKHVYPILTEPGLFVECAHEENPTLFWVVHFENNAGECIRINIGKVTALDFEFAVSIARQIKRQYYKTDARALGDSQEWRADDCLDPTWDQFVLLACPFLPHVKASEVRQVMYLYRMYVADWFGNTKVADTCSEAVDALYRNLLDDPLANPDTPLKVVQLFSDLMDVAAQLGIVEQNPILGLQLMLEGEEVPPVKVLSESLIEFMSDIFYGKGANFDDFECFYEGYVDYCASNKKDFFAKRVVAHQIKYEENVRKVYRCGWYPTLDKMTGSIGWKSPFLNHLKWKLTPLSQMMMLPSSEGGAFVINS